MLLDAVQYVLVLRECEAVCTGIVDEGVAVYPLLIDNGVQLIDELPTP